MLQIVSYTHQTLSTNRNVYNSGFYHILYKKMIY